MADMEKIVKLAVDGYKNRVENYSNEASQDVLRQELVALNGGKTTLDYKAIRDGKCQGLFTLIETILNKTVISGLTGDEFFNDFVDFRNVDEGDQNLFIIEDETAFVVDDTAKGTQGIRRQRLSGSSEFKVPTSMKMVRIYEELNRVLSGRVDFNVFINKVADAFRKKILEDIYTLWTGVTSAQLGGVTYFPVAGAYDEDALLDLIAHVEAAAGGKTATIVGTKKAIRQLKESVQSDGAKEELHNYGYYGSFYGTPIFAMPQRHKTGTTTFALDDKSLVIVAGDEKFIKFVYEGNPIVLMGNPMDNADLTQEYLYGTSYGLALVTANQYSGIGVYKTT